VDYGCIPPFASSPAGAPLVNAFESRRDRAQLLLVVLGIAITYAVLPFASGLLGALVLHVAVAPVHRRLAAVMPRRLAALLVVVGTAVLILLPVAWLVTIAIDTAPDALRQLSANPALARLAAVRIGDVDIGTRVVAAGDALISWVSSQALRVLGGAVRGTLNASVALFGLYFLLRAPSAAWRRVATYLPFSADGAALVAHRFRQVTEATLLGTALTAALQGAAVASGFALTGLSDPWFWGVVTAIVSILPIFGSALVWAPGALALAAQGRYGAALTLALIGGVIASNIDNVMRPLVNRRVSNLHPMITLVGAFAGVGVLGLPGILLGPLAITYFFELAALYRREYGVVLAPAPSAAGEPGESRPTTAG
jgi:predicted PurR-regulated permease PerM